MDDKFDTRIAPNCREETIQGRATEIRTVDKYGYLVDSRYVYAKNEIVTRCFPTLETEFDKFLGYSWKAQATVWRLEPEIASQILAASEGNEAAIRALEAYGFPVPASRLIEAIKGGDVFRVTELLNHGARLNALLPDAKAKDYSSRHATPLHWAALAGQTQVARLLLERGADVSARDDADQTAMQYANCYFYTDKDKTRSLTQLLLAHGANPNVDCYSGRTPLWLAANNGDVELVRDLLEHGADRSRIADRSTQQPLGQTALDRAKSNLEFEKKWGKKHNPSTTATEVAHYNQIIALLSSTVTPAKPITDPAKAPEPVKPGAAAGR